MTEEDVRARIGHRFPGGPATIEPYADWLPRDVVGSPPASDDLAHPLAAFLLATHGLGVDLDDLFALFGASAADGPLLGEWTVDVIEPLRAGQAYLVSGEVVGAGGPGRIRALSLRLTATVLAGDRLAAGGRVTSVSFGGLVDCEVWLDVLERAGSRLQPPLRALAGTASVLPR